MKVNKATVQLRIGAVGGLLATAIAVLSQLVSVDSPDRFLSNASIFLAVAIPLLTLDLYLLVSELIIDRNARSTLRGLLRLISILFFLIAMANIFFHFSQLSGFLFSFVTVLAIGIFISFYRALSNKAS